MLPAVERRARLIGVNHVALEVGDIDAALALYARLFSFELRGRVPGAAFIDMGDQFIALAKVARPHKDDERHFSVVVDDRSRVKELAEAAGGKLLAGPFLDFLDPWGNHFQIVAYQAIQFERSPGVKRKLGIEDLAKSESAVR